MSDVFGATIAIKDNVSGVLKQARDSSKGFSNEVEKAKRKITEYNKQKMRQHEIKIKHTQAYKAIEQAKQKLRPLTKKVVTVTAKTELAIEKIKKVKGSLDKIKDNKIINMTVKGASAVGKKVGNGVASATKAIGKAALVGTAAAFTAVTVASASAVTSAIDFQAQMQNVGTLLDGDVNGKLEKYSKQLKGVSNDTGIATSDLTDGLYQVVSAFGESEDNVKQLEIAAKAAKAGNATTTDSVNMLSSVTKAYGDTSAAAMEKAADLAFLTVKLGQTSFPELAASMGGAIAMGSQLGASQEELYGVMATLTGVTGNTAEVSTQLEGVLSGFLAPTDSLSKALKKMGYSSGAAALEAEGLEGVILKLKDQVGGSSLDLANLFSDKSAKQAVLGLTGDLADTWHEKTAAMADASGATEKAFATQTNSVKAMSEKIKNFGQNMLTSVGEKALPYIQSALDKVIDKFPEFESAIGKVVDKVAPGIEKLGSILSDLWTQWQPTISQIRTSFTTAFDAVKPSIDAMLVNFSTIAPYIQPIVASVSSTLATMLPVVSNIFSGISSVVSAVFPVVAEIVTGIGDKLQAVFQRIGGETGTLKGIFEKVGPIIASVLSAVWDIASPILDLAIEGIGVLSDAVGFAFPYIQSAIESVWNVIEPIINGFVQGISGITNKIRGLFGTANSETASAKGGSPSSSVSANATGTNYFGGGWTTVGEHGPELMNLPSGTQIKSNSESQNMIKSSSPNINITIEKMEVRDDGDIDKVAEALAKKLEEAEDNK